MGNTIWQIWSLKTTLSSSHVFPTLDTLLRVLSMVSVAACTQIMYQLQSEIKDLRLVKHKGFFSVWDRGFYFLQPITASLTTARTHKQQHMQSDWLHFVAQFLQTQTRVLKPEATYATGGKCWGFCTISCTPPVPQITQVHWIAKAVHIKIVHLIPMKIFYSAINVQSVTTTNKIKSRRSCVDNLSRFSARFPVETLGATN